MPSFSYRPQTKNKTVAPTSVFLVLRNYLKNKEYSIVFEPLKAKGEEMKEEQISDWQFYCYGWQVKSLESRGNCLLNPVSSKGTCVF